MSRGSDLEAQGFRQEEIWEFPKLGIPSFGLLIIRILLFRVLY